MVKILVLVSGGGTNLQALIDAEKKGILGNGKLALVISDRNGTYAIERAKAAGIDTAVLLPDKNLPKPERRQKLSDAILQLCDEKKIDLIVHAGFLSILSGDIIEAYSGRMINLHPALLPKFGGQNMYGENVHKAVLASGDTESGCTVHLVESGIDTGKIILQRKVPVLPDYTPKTLAERIYIEEHIAIVEAARLMIDTVEKR